MSSTYSNLKIQLMATGENATTWGAVTNLNLGTAIEEAITGSADVTFASANQTLTLTDTNTSQTARNLRLNCIGTTGGATRTLTVPAIEKQYIVKNGCADSITIKNATGTGITVPAGKTMGVFNDATNVVDATTYLSSLTLGAALPVASGGTGVTTATNGQLLIGNGTGFSLATLTQGSGVSITNSAGGITIAATGSGGTVTSVGMTVPAFLSVAGSPITGSGTLAVTLSGTALPVANGGTGATSLTSGFLVKGNGTGAATASVVADNGTGIGIGTSSPTGLFELASNSDASGYATTYVTSAVGAGFVGRKARGTLASPSAVAINDVLVSVSGRGYTSAGAFSSDVGGLSVTASDAFTGTAQGTNVTLSTVTGSTTTLVERLRINSSGNLTMGTTDDNINSGPGLKMRPAGSQFSSVSTDTANTTIGFSMYSTGAAAYRFYVSYDGKINCTNTTIAAISDIRLKENIRPLDYGLTTILAMKPRRFDWKPGKGKDIKNDIGFIAQEVEPVVPEMIGHFLPGEGDPDDLKSVSAGELIPILVKAVQELAARVAQLEAA